MTIEKCVGKVVSKVFVEDEQACKAAEPIEGGDAVSVYLC